jgi:Ca2+-binding EF-hand superfamily protein
MQQQQQQIHNFKYSPFNIDNPLNPNEFMQDINDVFIQYSSDKVHLSRFEYTCTYISIFGRDPSVHDMNLLFPMSGHRMSYQQYMNVVCDKLKKQDNHDYIKKIYNEFDRRGNGYLTIEDVEYSFHSVNRSIPKHVIARVFTMFDKNSDGKITLKDFTDILNSST